MAQHDYVIANDTGANVRADINTVLAAIVSQNSGATEPATLFAWMFWLDTTTSLLKLRDGTNTAWITIGSVATESLGALLKAGGVMTGALGLDNEATVATPDAYFDGDTDTGLYSPSANVLGLVVRGFEIMRANGATIGEEFISLLGTIGVVVPSGTTAQRHPTPTGGTVRVNTTLGELETYINGGWEPVNGQRVTYPFASPFQAGSTNFTTAGVWDEVAWVEAAGGPGSYIADIPDGVDVGQRLTLIGANDVDGGVLLAKSLTNVALRGNIILKEGVSIILAWDGVFWRDLSGGSGGLPELVYTQAAPWSGNTGSLPVAGSVGEVLYVEGSDGSSVLTNIDVGSDEGQLLTLVFDGGANPLTVPGTASNVDLNGDCVLGDGPTILGLQWLNSKWREIYRRG